MSFPTIPTVAAGRVLTAVQADAVATRTFPSLSSLTKNAGDLLIAIVWAYQTTAAAGAAFGTWGGGFTEIRDSSSSTTMAVGIAYKWSTGSETGTFSVTQAATITGHANMILLSIPGAHATTPPEASVKADGTTSIANPAAFTPSGWGSEDTLWIATGGAGETSLTGSFTGMGSAPASYTDYAETGISADVVGGVGAAVAFHQFNVPSEDIAGFTGVDTSNARNSAVIIAVRPAPTTVPGAPTIGTATGGNAQASVAFTPPASDGGSAILDYRITATPAVALGSKSEGTTADFVVNGAGAGFIAVAPASATIRRIGMRTKVANAGLTAVQLGIYANSGGNPGALVSGAAVDGGVTNARGTTEFYATLAAAQSIVGGTTYHLAVAIAGEQFDWQGTAATSAYSEDSGVAGVLPNPWVSIGRGNNRAEIWADAGGVLATGIATSPGTITGLDNGQAYTFTVAARNAIGYSAESAASNSVTPAVPDTTAPVVTLTSASTFKMSDEATKDAYSYSFTTNENIQAWEARVMSSLTAPRTSGTIVESGGAVSAGVPVTGTITYAELVAAGMGAEGAKLIDFFAQDTAGNWSGVAAAQSVNNFDVQTLTSPNRPSSVWRPFADSAPFNTPILDTDALYDDGTRTSASIISYLVTASGNDIPETLIFNTGESASDFHHPLYFAKSTDDLVTLHNRYDSSYSGNYGGNYGSFPTEGIQIRVPHAALPAGSSATTASGTTIAYNVPVQDAHMHVVQPNGDVISMYRVERGWADGGSLWCRASGSEPLVTGDGRIVQGGVASAVAAGYAGTPMLRAEDLTGGVIEHAFFMTTYRTRGVVYPAIGAASEVTDTHAPPNGAHFRYAPDDTFIDAQTWPSWVKLIMKAMHKYGLYVGDTGGATTDRIVVKMESDQVYRSFPGTYSTPNPIEAWAIANSVPSRVSSSIGPNRTVYELVFSTYAIAISDFEIMAPAA